MNNNERTVRPQNDLAATFRSGNRSAATEKKAHAALPVIVGDGIQIESDGGVMQANGNMRLLSLLGAAKTARYLTAQLATGKRLDVQTEPLGPWAPVWGTKDGGYKRLRRGVSARATHTLLIGRSCDATRLDESDRTFTFMLRRDQPDRKPELIYTAFLIALLDEPLAPSWAEWLWRRARSKGEARPLVVWAPVLREAWECDVPATLRTDLSAALAGDSPYGMLPMPEALTTA